eukprot:4523679-Pyramimonas_sp.AAC.1
MKFFPNDIDVDLCTHINFAFAIIDGSTFEVKKFEWNDDSTEWTKVTRGGLEGFWRGSRGRLERDQRGSRGCLEGV